REGIAFIDGGGARGDLRLREAAHRFTQGIDLFAEGKGSHACSRFAPPRSLYRAGPGPPLRHGSSRVAAPRRAKARRMRPGGCALGAPGTRQPPRVRPRKRGPTLPMCGSLILPMMAIRSSAMRSAAL